MVENRTELTKRYMVRPSDIFAGMIFSMITGSFWAVSSFSFYLGRVEMGIISLFGIMISLCIGSSCFLCSPTVIREEAQSDFVQVGEKLIKNKKKKVGE